MLKNLGVSATRLTQHPNANALPKSMFKNPIIALLKIALAHDPD
jgi:hypothetical protein